MGITDRHKKPGGFKKLVHSLETTGREKREKIIELMRREDPDFTAEVEKCLFQFEEFKGTNESILAEITSHLTEMRTLAFALHKYDDKLLVKFNRCLSPSQRYALKEAIEGLSEEKILRVQQISAQFKIIEKARQLEGSSNFVLKKYSEAYRD